MAGPAIAPRPVYFFEDRSRSAQSQPERRRWSETSRTRLDEIWRALDVGLQSLVAARRHAWGLAQSLAKSGNEAHVAMTFHTERIEPQEVSFSFRVPPPARVLDEIRAEMRALLDRAID